MKKKEKKLPKGTKFKFKFEQTRHNSSNWLSKVNRENVFRFLVASAMFLIMFGAVRGAS